jgi:hypothetical protein
MEVMLKYGFGIAGFLKTNKMTELKYKKDHKTRFGAATCSSCHLIRSAFCDMIYCILISAFLGFFL